MVHPQNILLCEGVVNNLGSEVDAIRSCLHVKSILALERPVFQVGTGVDPESVISSKSTTSK